LSFGSKSGDGAASAAAAAAAAATIKSEEELRACGDAGEITVERGTSAPRWAPQL